MIQLAPVSPTYDIFDVFFIADAEISDTALLFSVYSTTKYWSLICSCSTCFIYNVLNEALRIVTDASISLQQTTYEFFQTSSHLSFDNK